MKGKLNPRKHVLSAYTCFVWIILVSTQSLLHLFRVISFQEMLIFLEVTSQNIISQKWFKNGIDGLDGHSELGKPSQCSCMRARTETRARG